MASSASKFSKIVVGNETHKSARNVLEGFAKDIKGKASIDAEKHAYSLKGNLKDAKFNHDFFKIKSDMPGNPCYLDFAFHSNTPGNQREYRHPCARSMNKNLFNLEGAVCTNSKIKGNEEKINGAGACAPYRRRHICDLNLEHIDVHNVQNIHDLLGNVLVTAKYEGESIVEKHPNRGSSEVCTALARSFADIGDIIRGKDLYLGHEQGNNKLEARLKTIFQNIKNKNKSPLDKLSLEQVREYWWALNREDVWKALTCFADGSEEYFIQSSDKEHSFSSEYCGHEQGNVPTNLDYVPQFLRWFDEWADDFCRIKKIKLENVKNACRDEKKRKYCSLNGFDCTQTIWKKGVLHRSNECTGCLVKCNPYEIWLGNQREAFRKQKEKYENEIKTYVHDTGISNSNINNEYYKEFYKILKNNNYETANEFIKLLNEGRYCNKKEKIEEEEDIDFTNTNEKGTFYRSDYCQVCPDCGVECKNETCTPKTVIYPDCGKNEKYEPPGDAKNTEINVINSGDKEGYIFEKLSEFCTNENTENINNYEQWKCYYDNKKNNNKCKMEINIANSKLKNKVTSFDEFFDFWVRKLLIDTIKWETELTYCINNTDKFWCNKCNKNCVCFDKWVKQKEDEWTNIMKLFTNKHDIPKKYYLNINDLFDSFFFQVIYKFNEGEAKWNELKENLKKQIASSKANNGTKDSEAAIKVLFNHIKEIATICKDNNTNEGCDPSVDSKTNSCGKNTKAGSDKVISVKQIAQYYKRIAHKQLNERGSRSALKGDASKGTYKKNGTPSNLKEICEITAKHSNDSRRDGEPCTGKDGGQVRVRTKIGTPWTKIVEINKTSYKEVFLPPRRQHMCTSNLEHLNTGNKGLKDGKLAIHSLLGDVLLAAKEQANFIKNKYKRQKASNGFKDKGTICRAIRYSYADLGDIIKGTDLWEANPGEKNTQRRLKTVFGIIKKNMPGIKDNQKYKDDEKNNPPYKLLREDWWEANRDQVWQAMKCAMKNGITCGSSDHTPLDDYIPQKLRWLTEWAEWYCKAQSKEYEKLKEKCKECKGNDQCTQDTPDCEKCKAACKKYGKNIKTWEDQWKVISSKYKELYKQAEIYAGNGGPGYYNTKVQEEDKPVVDFLYNLYLQNGGKKGPPPDTHPSKSVTAPLKQVATVDTPSTVYSTPEGYIHQEAAMDCKQQHVFCDDNSGGKDDNKQYAFRHQPHDYDEALRCDQRDKPPPESKKVEKAKKEKDENDDGGSHHHHHHGGGSAHIVVDAYKPTK
uniref:PfEMP1 n=1 Tax=Plasmodium falciparum (isolate HB3) TaxID=137071 RepID=UPI0027403099|nr:Chain A, PfEMP1 [Plasmodium falciparum HB3]